MACVDAVGLALTFNGGLPPFLTKNAGLNSGFMIGQVPAAALARANKHFSHTASVDSIPASANQEDHVSMATHAAYKLKDIVDNVQGILAIKLLAACQGIDLRQPLKTSLNLQAVHALLRETVYYWEKDRNFSIDITKSRAVAMHVGQFSLSLVFFKQKGIYIWN